MHALLASLPLGVSSWDFGAFVAAGAGGERDVAVVTDRGAGVSEVGGAGPPAPVARAPPAPVDRRRQGTASAVPRTRERVVEGGKRFCAALTLERDHDHFFHFVPVLLGAGAVLWFSLGLPPSTMALVILSAVVAGAGRLASIRNPQGARLLAAAALVFAGMLLADLETRRAATTILDSGVTTLVTGVVERREAGPRGEWRYLVRVTSTAEPRLKRPPERVSLLAKAGRQAAALGETLTGRARLSPPSGPALPGLNDFAFSSYFNGVGAVGFFLGAPRLQGVEKARDGETAWAAGEPMLLSLRDGISTRIRAVIGGDPGAFAASIVTGERRAMSREATEALRLSGLAHITAISGLNMALASGIFFVGLRMALSLLPGLAQALPIKKIAAGGALAAAFAYLLISGYQVSAVRAFLMTAIMLIAVLFDRPAISLRNLCLAAIVIIALTPSAVMGPSFQMSFAATAALIAGYAAWRGRPRRSGLKLSFPGARLLGECAKLIGGTFLTSLIGGLSTAIFAIAHFHRMAPHGLEANLAAMPIISMMVMPAGLIAMLLTPFGLDWPFLAIMGLGLEWVLVIAHVVAGWDEPIGFARMPAWFLPAASLGLLLLTLLRTRLRHAGSAVLAVVVAILVLRAAPPAPDILIAEDGRLVGVLLSKESVATNRARPPRFIFEQWQAALGFDQHVGPQDVQTSATGPPREAPPPTASTVPTDASPSGEKGRSPGAGPRRQWTEAEIQAARAQMNRAASAGGQGRFQCAQKLWCVARVRGGWTIATVDEPAFIGGACDVADIVISARRVAFSSCRSGARLFTAETLRRSGAIEIRLGRRDAGEMALATSFTGPARAWSIHRRYDWRSGSFLTETAQEAAGPAIVEPEITAWAEIPSFNDSGE